MGISTKILLTANGLKILNEQLKKQEELYLRLSKQKSEIAKVGGNDWHDNFSFEELERDQKRLEHRIMEIKHIIKNSQIVNNFSTDAVGIGSVIIFEMDGKEKKMKIGDYVEASPSEGVVSYMSPIGQVMMGAVIGETRTFKLNGKNVLIKIKDIK